MKNLIVLLAASLTFSQSTFAQYNTSPVLIPIDDYKVHAKELEQSKYIQFRVTDLLAHLEAADRDNQNIYDAENVSYLLETNSNGDVNIIKNMGIAITGVEAAASFEFIEVKSGEANADWKKLKDLSEKAASLVTPKSYIRFDLNKIPMAGNDITLKFKLWDMSNVHVVDAEKPYDTSILGNDSPFSKDTQVVYFKIPWELFN